MSSYFIQTAAWADVKGSVLVMPAVAAGNVGELTVDALIVSLGLERVGYLDDPNLLPCAGNDPYYLDAPGTLTTNLELYGKSGSPVYVLQQRAPAIVGRQQDFAANLAAWIKESGIRCTLVITGLSSQYRRDKQIEGPQLRFICDLPDVLETLKSLGVMELEEELLKEEENTHSLLPPWVFLTKCKSEGVPVATLGVFASEGDNIPDAIVLLQCVLPFLKKQPGLEGVNGDLQKRPVSWGSVYGRSFERSIYTV